MATTLSQGSAANITVAQGQYVELNNASTGRARIEFDGKIIEDQHRGRRKYGPFNAGTVRVGAIVGTLTYDSGADPDTSSGGGFDAGFSLTELVSVQTLTDTGTAFTGACDYAGIKVRAVSGTVNLTVYDATSATGTAIDTKSAVSLTGGPGGDGYYPWARNKVRPNTTGCHVVFSGGGTATIDVLAG